MKPDRRFRWKSVAVLAIVLLVGVVATCFFVNKARERKEFISKAVSGYRCRFTLPSDWLRGEIAPPVNYSGQVCGVYVFTTPPLDPAQEWIHHRLFPSEINTDPVMNVAANQPWSMQIVLSILDGKSLAAILERLPENGERVVTERDLTIDGCPLTILRTEWISPLKRRPLRWLAYTPDHSVLFEATSRAEIHDNERIDQEMEAILSSLHIEKVTVPAGSKR